MTLFFSVIVPVYNRPEEISEFLNSICEQNFAGLEIIIVEDGSTNSCKEVVDAYSKKLNIKYILKSNSGQGFSRNLGAKNATGKWLIFFDSDCVIPSEYFNNLEKLIINENVSAFCGPDTASPDFSNLQKAISQSMTSVLTTGGIRGEKNTVEKVSHLRSYNMVVEKEVFDDLGGFGKTNMGEDMEFSHRFHKKGHKALIAQSLFVYHKRRNSLKEFFFQIFSFGRTRIILYRDFRLPIKPVHYLPVFFVIGLTISFFGTLLGIKLFEIGLTTFCIYALFILIESTIKWRSLIVGLLSILTSFIQLVSYGLGMIKEFFVSSQIETKDPLK